MNFKFFIIGIYLTFVGLIVMMVFKSCQQKVELETTNYYNEELAFQSTIDARNNGNPYIDSFKVLRSKAYMEINHPVSVKADSVVLCFKKPDNAAADKKMLFKGNQIKPMLISDFEKGVYNLSISSYSGGKVLMVQKKIKI